MRYLIIACLVLTGCVRNEPVIERLPVKSIQVDTTYKKTLQVIRCPYNVDSLLHANDSLTKLSDTLATRLLYNKLVISNVSYYVNICNRKPSQDKFLRGWINRALR